MALDALRCSHLAPLGFKGLYPFHTYARMLRITADALSVAIRSGSVLYAHCIRNVSVDPLRSAAIRSPILKVISCFTYAADAADNVNPY